jgi:hypothetical protein
MIRANIRVKLSELDISLVEKLKSIFDNSNIVEIN